MRGRRRKGLRIRAEGVISADIPRCATCGKVLVRLPAVSSRTGARVFQCADCFYPGTGRNPRQPGVVSSDRTRWLDEVMSENG
ncbi:MAG: hypothetical protein ACE149_09300 [Armatimonadota bacterium]